MVTTFSLQKHFVPLPTSYVNNEEWLNRQDHQQRGGRHWGYLPLLELPKNPECQHYQHMGDVLNMKPPATACAAEEAEQ